jgi:hypothetical protein
MGVMGVERGNSRLYLAQFAFAPSEICAEAVHKSGIPSRERGVFSIDI